MRANGHRRSLQSLVTLTCIATLVALSPMKGWIGEASAAAPGKINVQGLLLDSGGAVVDGLVDLDFELFDAASGGTSLWSESQIGVSVLDGVYDVALGSITLIDASALAGGNVWLEITFEGETLLPRQRLLVVPYALRSAEADHATSADSAVSVNSATSADFATTADTAANLPSEIFEALYSNFPFDGAAPPNDDPSEGPGDTDNDGIANFIDPDNDNDGLSDAIELGQGSDINLVTPTISGALPSIADDIFPTSVTVTGTGFIAGQTVAVGSQAPTPTNITSTSFDIVLDAQPAPTSTNIVVTRPNAELASLPFNFKLTSPSIATLIPFYIDIGEQGMIDVVGTNFVGPLTVTFDGTPVTPTNVTATSFSILVDAPGVESSVPITVTLSNTLSTFKLLVVADGKIVFATSASYAGSAIGGILGGDAICASHATAAALPGTFLAWLGDSTGSPATRFTQAVGPYLRADGVMVAFDYADLIDGVIENPISVDENGDPLGLFTGLPYIWTGANSDGTVAVPHCEDWSESAGQAQTGLYDQTSSSWSDTIDRNCFTNHPIYCFQQ